MSTSFVSVASYNKDHWGVVVKTFPILREPQSISPLSVPSGEREVSTRVWDYAVKMVAVGEATCADQETAESTAKKMAEAAGLVFVPYKTNIVVLGPWPHQNDFIPYELKLDGTPGIYINGRHGPIDQAVKDGKELAEKKSLAFLYPNLYDINRSLTSNCSDRTAFDVTGDTSEPLVSVINLTAFLKNPLGGLKLGSSILEPFRAAGLIVPSEKLKEAAKEISRSILNEISDVKEKISLAQKWQDVFEKVMKKYPREAPLGVLTSLKELKVGSAFLEKFT